MIRRLRPCGQVAGCGASGIFTVTGYDPVTGRFVAVGHPWDKARMGRCNGNRIFIPHVTVPDTGGALERDTKAWGTDYKRIVGVFTKEGMYGSVGELWDPERLWWGVERPMETGRARPGPAVLYNSVAAPNGMSVEIGERYRHEGFYFRPQGANTYQGMSGSPIVQDGRLVGTFMGTDLWFQSRRNVAVDIEIMADELLGGA